ncbi:hypothetical protein ACS0TY_025500 [Phlomoides rotata]
MEKISLSMSSGATRSLDGAQQKGSIILNLKCVVAQCMRLLSVSIDESSELMMFGFETKQLGQGVVYRIKDSSITVAFDDIPEQGLNSPSRLEKLQNEVTYHWMKETLIQLSKGVKDPVVDLVPVLFGERPPTVSKPDIKFTLVKSNLDHPQKDAISKALSSKDLFFAVWTSRNWEVYYCGLWLRLSCKKLSLNKKFLLVPLPILQLITLWRDLYLIGILSTPVITKISEDSKSSTVEKALHYYHDPQLLEEFIEIKLRLFFRGNHLNLWDDLFNGLKLDLKCGRLRYASGPYNLLAASS